MIGALLPSDILRRAFGCQPAPVAAEWPLGLRSYYRDALVTLYHADANDLLPRLSADLIIADAPYSFGLNSTEDGLGRPDDLNT
jgi:hypothetical protein